MCQSIRLVVLYFGSQLLAFFFQLLDPLLELANELFAEVASFCELCFDLFVYLYISFERLDLLDELLVFEEELFGLFRLVF